MRADLRLVLGLALSVCACSGKSTGSVAVAGAAASTPFHTLALLAGNAGGPGSLDGTGSAASFNGVLGLASDGAGNLYAADSVNDTIRKVVLATGAVTTIAGTAGAPGTADGIGAAARFDEPAGVAFDGGNLYVADSGNCIIRKIVLATGAVTTIAGTAGAAGKVDAVGAAARFTRPQGVATDGAGNLYVADTYNDVVRQIVLASGAVSTISGASPGLPDSVASDGAGNLYVAGYGGSTVSKIDLATGVSTSLTPPNVGASGTTGLAIDRAGSLYFADGNSAVFALNLTSGAATLVAGSTIDAGAPTFSAPSGLALDGAGNLYVADGGSMIRKVALATGAVTTLAGSSAVGGSADGAGSSASFNGAAGLVLDGAGNLYVADKGNSAIRKIAIKTGVVTTAVFSSSYGPYGEGLALLSPTGLALDGAGNLFVADTGNMTITEIALSTGALTTFAGELGYNFETDGTGYDPSQPWHQGAATFSYPVGLAFDVAGSALFVTDLTGPTVRRVLLADGSTTTVRPSGDDGGIDDAGSDDAGAPARLRGPQGIVSDGAGNVYVADSASDTIRRVVLATGEVTVLAGSPGLAGSADGTGSTARFNYPIGLASDGAGNLYVADSASATIRKVVIATGAVTTILGAPGEAGDVLGPSASARLRAPSWLAYGPGPALYISDGNAVLVLR